MKNISKKQVVTYLILISLGFVTGFLFHSKEETKAVENTEIHNHTSEWTCSMHPQIRKSEAGKCPICGMDLIPVETHSETENANEIRMSPTAMQLASVQTTIVKKQKPQKEIRLNGKIQADERKIYSQTSHLKGRIETLKINFTGEFVQKGQVLAQLYSPQLVTAQEELLQAFRLKEEQAVLFEAAKQKLRNWKLSEKQINQILTTGKVQERFSILADVSGVVLSKKVNLGDYIESGNVLFEIADLKTVWVLFDVYEMDIASIKKGDDVKFTVQSYPEEEFKGKISYLDPTIKANTRITKARVEIENHQFRLKPEMFVSGKVTSLTNEKEMIIIPKTAVMWTGEKSLVYVKTSEIGGINFVMRKVTLGTSLGENYVIKEGLQEGEEIATNGTFSIDAAAQLAGKPSMMNTDNEVVEKTNPSKEVKESLIPLVDSYIALKNTLVKDDFESALKAAKSFEAVFNKINMSIFKGESHNVWMKHSAVIKKSIFSIKNAKDIDVIRKHFVALSEQMIMLAKTFEPTQKSLYIQHCPMADGDKGADWLSLEKEIKNPYFGDAMLTCGEVITTIK